MAWLASLSWSGCSKESPTAKRLRRQEAFNHFRIGDFHFRFVQGAVQNKREMNVGRRLLKIANVPPPCSHDLFSIHTMIISEIFSASSSILVSDSAKINSENVYTVILLYVWGCWQRNEDFHA